MVKKISVQRWLEANEGEKSHWNTVLNSKELTEREDGYYRHAAVMFLQKDNPTNISVIDIGGGPLSLTLHHDLGNCLVIDPILLTPPYMKNYTEHGISFIQSTAEDFLADYTDKVYDEVWMYNCLQHTIDPDFIMENLWRVGKVLRISEPTNTPINTLHPHSFTPQWIFDKLSSISIEGNLSRVDYDYPYCGGKAVLKRK